MSYPWNPGDRLTAADLNAEFAAKVDVSSGPFMPVSTLSVVNVLDHGAKGDGVTDDTAAIQAVLNANNSKATVFLPWTGNHYRTTGLTLPSGTDMLLYGTLRALAGLTGGYITIQNVVNVAIRGFGVIDASGSLQTAVSGMAGLAIDLSSHVHISGITIQNAFHWNINFTQCSDVVIDGCKIYGGGAANEFAAQATDCWMTNCLIDGTGNGDYGFCFYGGVTNCGAIGNVVKNAGLNTTFGPPGIGVMCDVAQQNTCSDIVIANNIIHDCAAGGITVLGTLIGATRHINNGIVVSGNRCYNNGRNATPAGQIADCFIDWSTDVTITGNQFGGFGGAGGASNGVYLGPQSSYISVTDNSIFNVGKGGGGTTSAGMWINSSTNAHVSNNYFYDDQTVHTMAWAIIGTAGAACSFIGNFLGVPPSFGMQSDTVMGNYTPGGYSMASGRMSFGAAPAGYTNAAGVARWFAGNSGGAEGAPGTNIGSDFAIYSVADAGSPLLLNPLLINRATGLTTLTSLAVSGNSGFYGTAPIAKPTGVAVSAAGIHAALVSLGLIAA